jgi:hypothetical protein
VGILLAAAFVAVSAVDAEVAAACSPRTFSSIQPPELHHDEVASDTDVAEQPVGETSGALGTVETPVDDVAATPPAPWTPPPAVCSFIYRMEFPVLGGGDPGWSVFGEPREGGARLHAGVDVLAPKMTPVVAVRSGTVIGVHDDPGNCCWMVVRHDDGWMSMYVHLNDDTVGTDDGEGIGIRPDLAVGVRVEQGEMIGWVGDSGNAEGGPPHLHFELWTPWGEPVDPGPSLVAARRRAHPALESEGLPSAYSGAFIDYRTPVGGQVFDTATALGLPAWCDSWAVRSCPGAVATRESVTRWMTALSGDSHLPYVVFEVDFVHVDPVTHMSQWADCSTPPLCGQPVTRGQLATLILANRQPALALDEAQAIGWLHARGQIDACSPDGLDPLQPLSREGALRMLLRAWGYLSTPPCDLIV